ncbi:MAG: phage terminase large subunit family protein [Brevundimonas sp.]|uniref:phage terminase large subunit family protein n=1 Tax=Brevundimonas sp. TaxID=1871086 RepID=UPI0025BD75CC|nr:phage terminase large subunit family protein [Brevundimonas sp.]MBX3476690.1 phage terminase large subunit family protein [Brevundimonas sp.]
MTDTLAGLRAEALRALRPPPRMQLADWIEKELRLPEDVSATPGRVRLWPYQRGIADAISDPTLERVTLMKSVRIGLSTLLAATVGNFIANDPAPILAVLPTDDDARNFVVDGLEKTFAATPILTNVLSDDLDESGRNTLRSKHFPGGSLKVVSAKSERNLRGHTSRIIIMDEVDAMAPGGEGDALTLAENRAFSYGNAKIIAGSTPTDALTSNVASRYEASDQRIFEVPCPKCGAFNEIRWAHIKWAKDQPETAEYECPHCLARIPERLKATMVDAGEWRITRPQVQGHAGFRINALVSTLPKARWGVLAAQFLEAKREAAKAGPHKLKVFVNTILAETWSDVGEVADEGELAKRAEPFGLSAIPAEVLFVTVGVDVQDDRLELVYGGHTADDVALILDARVVWGPSVDNDTWAELDDALKETWPHPNGGRLKVDAAFIDSGDGGAMDIVYDFCRPRAGRRIFAIKGQAGTLPMTKVSPQAHKRINLVTVGVDTVKANLANRLKLPESIRFSADLDARYYEELTSERRVTRYVAGRPVRRFERIMGRRAECLDATVYALAARQMIAVSPDQRAEALATAEASLKQHPSVIRSPFLMR